MKQFVDVYRVDYDMPLESTGGIMKIVKILKGSDSLARFKLFAQKSTLILNPKYSEFQKLDENGIVVFSPIS